MLTLLHKWREKTETIAATTAQTTDFSTLMPEHAIALWTFVLTGANKSLGGSGVDRYEGKLGTGLYFQMVPTEFRCLMEYLYSRYGGAAPATADLTYPIPFHLMNIFIMDQSVGGVPPEVGLPTGSIKIWQIFLNAANSSAGGATLGWIRSYREPTHIPYLIGHAVTGLTASVDNQPYRLPWQALPTAGFIINGFGATQFTRIRMYVPNKEGVMEEIFDLTRDQILLLGQPYSAQAVTDPIMISFGRTVIPREGSFMLINGGAGIVGTERFLPIQFLPVGAGIPGVPKAGAAA